jgi:hypothetical protein
MASNKSSKGFLFFMLGDTPKMSFTESIFRIIDAK